MKSAFNQIPLHLRDRHKTAFSTPDGDKYEFNRLCFGLKNSPKAFQSIAQEVLGDLLHNGALVYIDIILFTKTIDEHFELLSKVLERFEKIQLKFNTDIPFEWTSETQAAFEDIKEAILNPPVLALPDPAADLQITTDAPLTVLGRRKSSFTRYVNNIKIALPELKDLIEMQRNDPVLSDIIQKINSTEAGLQRQVYFLNEEGLLCHLSRRPSKSPRQGVRTQELLQDSEPTGLPLQGRVAAWSNCVSIMLRTVTLRFTQPQESSPRLGRSSYRFLFFPFKTWTVVHDQEFATARRKDDGTVGTAVAIAFIQYLHFPQ
ncbi:uncharacterized protein TNIN_451831 [Trichonephila inaurata madagascariensis]|uniref:Reverse transcriptase domain-containing protein n=1 Tax=Trichonephila inaurata madagascariensis TaxID=2747483 RepID=A0A8X6XBN1_9ARAC|nr:uncharacterized protein TNIN_451831 [Trichonephila inaurata madagascariensis]